jgi:hypothetical protein
MMLNGGVIPGNEEDQGDMLGFMAERQREGRYQQGGELDRQDLEQEEGEAQEQDLQGQEHKEEVKQEEPLDVGQPAKAAAAAGEGEQEDQVVMPPPVPLPQDQAAAEAEEEEKGESGPAPPGGAKLAVQNTGIQADEAYAPSPLKPCPPSHRANAISPHERVGGRG